MAKGARVIVTCSAKKHQTCLDLGADLAIDYKSEAFDEVINDYSKGKGVDMVLDFIGGPNFMKNIEVLAKGGQLIQIAMMGGPKTAEVNLYPILRKHLSIVGTTLRSRPEAYKTDLILRFQAAFHEAISNGQIRPVIDSVFKLEEIAAAHKKMAANLNVGKIVLQLED
jgi:NADPH:quinone reductase-like Zn-dependent oxidoreductase